MIFAIFVYSLAMTAANLSITFWGVWASPIIAFFFIGLDLALRDWLHVRLSPLQMGGLIVSAGILTYWLNPSAGTIAIASSVSFTVAAAADWIVFAKLKGSWTLRANGSNFAGAAVDSVLFPTIAFGVLMPQIVLLQFAAKVVGGAVWTLIIRRFNK